MSTATISVAGGSAPATTNIELAGSAGSIVRTAMLAVTSTTITVQGKVRNNHAGVRVGIVGKPAIPAGPDGAFSFTDVTPPYDLYVRDAGFTVFVFLGVTRADPSPAWPQPPQDVECPEGHCSEVAITGTRTGPWTTTDPVRYAWQGTSAAYVGNAVLNADGTYNGVLVWAPLSPPQLGTLYAIQFTTKPSGAPDSFIGYASSGPEAVSPGSVPIDLVAAPVPSSAKVKATIDQGNYFSQSVALMQQLGNQEVSLFTSPVLTRTVDLTFPLIPGFRTWLALHGESPAGVSDLSLSVTRDTGGSVYAALQPPAVLRAPADLAEGITTSTHFSWTPTPSSVNHLTVRFSEISYEIFTTASDVTIPLIPGLSMDANAGGEWSVSASWPHLAVDEILTGAPDDSASSSTFGPEQGNTYSRARRFITAP